MMMLALLVAGVLLLIAALHVYWGLGGLWPGTDAADLAARVAGFAGEPSPPSAIASFLVAALLVYSAIVALVLGGLIQSPIPFFLLGPSALTITLIFVGRGIAGYTSAWRRLTPVEPFARLDRYYYSPLCLLIGAGIFTLGIRGFSG
jgi:hypothetical protein